MPRGASTSDHKQAYRRRLAQAILRERARAVSVESEPTALGRGIAHAVNVVRRVTPRVMAAEAKARSANRMAAEENILRRSYNQGDGPRNLEVLIDTKEGRKRKR